MGNSPDRAAVQNSFNCAMNRSLHSLGSRLSDGHHAITSGDVDVFCGVVGSVANPDCELLQYNNMP
jgi:hypothetical protein